MRENGRPKETVKVSSSSLCPSKAHLYGVRQPRQPSTELSWPGQSFIFFFLSNLIQPNVYIKLVESSRGGEERGRARGVRGGEGGEGG